MTSAFSWQNSVSLCPASFCTPKPHLPVIPGISTSYFCIPVPYNEKDIFFGCQLQKVLQVFIESFKFSFFIITGQGIGLDYCDIEWFALETKRDHSVVFEIASKYCILHSFVDYDGYSISRDGNTKSPDVPPETSVCRSGSNSQNWTQNNRLEIGRAHV